MTRRLAAAGLALLVATISWFVSAGEHRADPEAAVPLPGAPRLQAPRSESGLSAPEPAPEARPAVDRREQLGGPRDVGAGRQADVDGAVRVRVVDASGVPVPGVIVNHLPDGASPEWLAGPPVLPAPTPQGLSFDLPVTQRISTQETNDEGLAWFRELSPGPHSFQLRGENHLGRGSCLLLGMPLPRPSAWVRVELAHGQEREVELSTEPIAWVEGRLTELGAPLAGARLRLDPHVGGGFLGAAEGDPVAVTNRQGWYRFESVEAGSYDLVVEDDQRAMPAVHEVAVPTTGTRFDIDLDVCVVEGRVTDPQGHPVRGARVEVRLARRGLGRSPLRFAFAGSEAPGHEQPLRPEWTGPGVLTVITGADGRFRLGGMSSGVSLLLTASGTGFCPSASRTLWLEPHESRSGVDLELQRGATLLVRVLDERGQPDSTGAVLLRNSQGPGGATRVLITDGQGRGSFPELEPGRWSVSVPSKVGALEWDRAMDVELRAGDEREVEMVRLEPVD